MKNVVYIHGANACPDNFNYYTLKLPEHKFISPEYSICQTHLRRLTPPSMFYLYSENS